MTIVTEFAPTHSLTFRETVALVASRAKERLPQAVNGRVEAAVKLVLGHDVTPQADGTIQVGSSSDPMKVYRLTGQACECQDYQHGKAPEGWCQHRIAAGIYKRVHELLPAPVEETRNVPVSPPAPLGEAPASGIDPKYLTHIQGRPFVCFEGLLALAHERGLVELSTTVVSVTPDFAVCQAVARFHDGRVFTDIGDATPQNVKKQLAPHFIRLAATRASARALRRALNIDTCSLEELGEGD
jgi:hypothetical protein